MTDAQLFMVTLVLLYAVECVHRVPAGAVVFRGWRPGRCTARIPLPVGEGRRSALVLSNPIPPFGLLFFALIDNSDGGDPPDLSHSRRAIRRTWLRYRLVSLPLRIACTVHFLITFVVLPLTWTVLGSWAVTQWLAAYAVSLAFVLTASYRAHRALFPDRSWWPMGVHMLVYPPAALQATTTVSIGAFEAFHPVAVASVVCPPKDFVRFGTRFLRELAYPTPSSLIAGDKTRAGRDPEYRRVLFSRIAALVEQSGLTVETLLAPPEKLSDESRSYCPRCLAQYGRETGTCSDCSDIPLQALMGDEPSAQCGS